MHTKFYCQRYVKFSILHYKLTYKTKFHIPVKLYDFNMCKSIGARKAEIYKFVRLPIRDKDYLLGATKIKTY